MSESDKWVRRFSVDETYKHKDGFTIYKITSILFPLQSPEAVTVVVVWKRYSELQTLHHSMQSLHAALYLPGEFPPLTKWSYFKRFNQEVIDERMRTIKKVLEFIAEHRLLFTSTDVVNFLQSGYPAPESAEGGVIQEIRDHLELPLEEPLPPLRIADDEVDCASASQNNTSAAEEIRKDTTLDISEIKVFEPSDVELRESPKKSPASLLDSFESIDSLQSIDSDLFDELSKMSIDKPHSSVKKKPVLPDLINFDEPSTSRFEDFNLTQDDNSKSETVSLNSTIYDSSSMISEARRSTSGWSLHNYRGLPLTHADRESKMQTEDSYIFEAGYVLNLAARCEESGDYQRAFEYYKSGIEKMLIGVQSDTDAQRRAIIKEKTNKYLSYAERIYKNHLTEQHRDQWQSDSIADRRVPGGIPLCMLRKSYADLGQYRVLAVVAPAMMLVLDKTHQHCYVIKVIRKIPNNMSEFDQYLPQRSETKQPILPTNIPYMVTLHNFIETNNLIFLILSYAPGQKLMEYIRNYIESIPSTPAREVNLENVFSEPQENRIMDARSEPLVPTDVEGKENEDLSVRELVRNSQKLLQDVDMVLNGGPGAKADDVREVKREGGSEVKKHVLRDKISASSVRDAIPPSTVCGWAAQLLLCLEHLHNSGVICRDLNSDNILLGDKGQIIVTYAVGYEGGEAALRAVRRGAGGAGGVAPELYGVAALQYGGDRRCDYWSYGAVLYELVCGVPLSYYHRSVFTSHTILHLPDNLPLEVQSILTQLLTYEPTERLGAGKDGVEEIKCHPYFKNINWQQVYEDWIVPD